MHSIDGGALYFTIKQVFGVGLDRADLYLFRQWNATHLRHVNNVFEIWAHNTPMEFSRRPRPITKVKLWKMRETAMVGIYIIPALFAMPDFRKLVSPSLLNAYMNLIAGIRLVGGYSTKPVSQVCSCCSSFIVHFMHYLMLIL